MKTKLAITLCLGLTFSANPSHAHTLTQGEQAVLAEVEGILTELSDFAAPTHQAQCECKCGGTPITFIPNGASLCDAMNGQACTATGGSPATLENCRWIIVPTRN